MKDQKKTLFERIDKFLQDNGMKAKVVQKFESVLLADGVTEVVIEPAIEVGAAIVVMADGEPVAASPGEYELQDGRVIVVQDEGVVAEIREPQTEEAPVEEEELSTNDNVKRIIERIEKEKIFKKVAELESKQKEVTKVNEFLKKDNEEMAKKYSELMDFVKESMVSLKEIVGAEPSKEPIVKPKGSISERKNYFLNR